MVVTLQYLIYLMRTLSHPPQWFSFALTHRLIKSLDLQFNIWYLISVSSVKEKATAPHSSTLAWKIPWTEEPGGLQSMGSRRVGHDWATSFTFHFYALEKEMATHSSGLAWRISGKGEPGGLLSMGLHRVGHDWSDLAAVAAASRSVKGGTKCFNMGIPVV